MLRSVFARVFFAFTVLAVCFSVPMANAAPTVWKVVSNTRNSLQFEKWQWFAEEVKQRTNGEIACEVISFPELNLTGAELIRMLNSNLLDVAEVVTGYVSGDAPALEAAQITGSFRDYRHNQAGYEAFLPVVKERYSRIIGGIPVGSFSFGPMHVWTRFPVNSPSDMKGKKIRVFSVSQADYLQAMGAEGVFIPLADMYVALERGLVDGTITGAESAAGQKLWEVTKHVTEMRFGAGAGFVVISRKSYEGISDKNKAIVDKLFEEINARGWDIGQEDSDLGIQKARDHGMTVNIESNPEWEPALVEMAKTVVVPRWTERAGKGSKELFNQVIAPVVGFEIK